MRRPLALTVVIALALGACSDDSSDDSGSDTGPSDGTSDVAVDPTAVDPLGSTPEDSTSTVPRAPKPAVSVPDEIPSELQITDLVAGTGYAAEARDILVVDYVGVRTEDGVEFDTSYNIAFPFGFPLGQGDVIAGWEEGLIGVQVGTKRQLDIPADLAYRDNPPDGSIVQAGDALTFVIEVRAVIPAPDPADAPLDLALEPSVGATELSVIDVADGTGEPVTAGQVAVVYVLFVRGDDGTILFNSWETGEPRLFQLVEGDTLQGLVKGVALMRVGGRRLLTLPPDEAFGPGGDPELGLPANTDLIVIAELLGYY